MIRLKACLKLKNMINKDKRKSIAKSFISEFFRFRYIELWKNYKCNDEKGNPKSWCPIPCPWVHTNKEDPIIGVAETFDEAKEIVEAELPESRWDMVEYEEYKYVDGNTYFVIYD